ncbi:hypothetical protein [Streptomyces sp. NPDC058665]|uniref:hypothetical protein n=1 Tax=Streptomyces sp. NPDC058665 TaxID=3346586 RepID=UPI00365B8EE2
MLDPARAEPLLPPLLALSLHLEHVHHREVDVDDRVVVPIPGQAPQDAHVPDLDDHPLNAAVDSSVDLALVDG